jgi:predicted 2-oxoglutarate/Fe(II)-dependent dioxygenase YbiX
MITPVNTGHPLVFRFDNILSSEECLIIENYVKNNINITQNTQSETLPWEENQNIYYHNVKDSNVKQLINVYRFLTSQLIFSSFNQLTLPTFTDIVFWQEGKSMPWHVDNGYNKDQNLSTRIFSSILYVNDDFEGGETLIKGSPNYTSVPQKGSIIFFKSDKSCLHSVNKILKGNRITLASWFTIDKKHVEI